jgi:hypothetical protein
MAALAASSVGPALAPDGDTRWLPAAAGTRAVLATGAPSDGRAGKCTADPFQRSVILLSYRFPNLFILVEAR